MSVPGMMTQPGLVASLALLGSTTLTCASAASIDVIQGFGLNPPAIPSIGSRSPTTINGYTLDACYDDISGSTFTIALHGDQRGVIPFRAVILPGVGSAYRSSVGAGSFANSQTSWVWSFNIGMPGSGNQVLQFWG